MSSAKQYNLQPSKVIDEATVSADVTSSITEIMNKDNIVYQIKWTGTLNIAFDVQVSSNYDPRNASAASWDSLPLLPAPAATGSAGSWTIDLSELGSKYIKLFCDYSSGSGALEAWISGKAV